MEKLAAAERQELLGDPRGPLGGPPDVLHVLSHDLRNVVALEHELGASEDDRHLVVRFVGHAAGELTHRLEAVHLPQLLFRPPPLGDVALRAPGPQQQAVLDNADEVVEEVAVAPVHVALVRLRLDEAIAVADPGAEKVDVVGIGARQEISQRDPGQIGRRFEAVHPCHRVVALAHHRVGKEVVHLVVLGQAERHGLFQLDPPHPLGGLLDEGAVALLAGTEHLFRPFPLGDVLGHADESNGLALAVPHECGLDVDPHRLAILPAAAPFTRHPVAVENAAEVPLEVIWGFVGVQQRGAAPSISSAE